MYCFVVYSAIQRIRKKKKETIKKTQVEIARAKLIEINKNPLSGSDGK